MFAATLKGGLGGFSPRKFLKLQSSGMAFTAISAANDNELVFVSPVVND